MSVKEVLGEEVSFLMKVDRTTRDEFILACRIKKTHAKDVVANFMRSFVDPKVEKSGLGKLLGKMRGNNDG